ncbi:TcfC E-set like domain-containing protein [Pseudomonas mosselii]|uniref:TcfC E-set like domain-containing protein n=1 Tax=Pseudomonas mosselii TaxID=78327 RepID=UPI002DB8D521|nr:TcfC E-set like domain-containing protein [Pseudomonas mosselii]MEB5932394.1 TcfC E-set like domain-containing protein [Pseudomonas mosselii]
MFRLACLSVVIVFAVCEVVHAHSASATSARKSLLAQAQGLPKEFHEHFFGVPLAVRVMLDQQVLGEAMVILSRDERVTLLDFTDTRDSDIAAAERERWQSLLQQGVTLGRCTKHCAEGLIAVDYSLANSELTLLSEKVEREHHESEHYELPVGGSQGVMLRNQLNVSGGQRQDMSGRYAMQAISSVGNWTQTFNGQLTKLGGPQGEARHAVYELHTQREWQDNFLRLGYFTPDSIGLSRQVRSFGASPDTALGIMLGTSDSLAKDIARPAIYPIHVTVNREATVEIYRNGALIHSQSVRPGLQALDTRPLPGGIYDVEVRVVEDGIITSRSKELVYKPNNWSKPEQRWRYNVFLGRESTALSSWKGNDKLGATAGVAVNYLLHPRAVVGASARQVRGQSQVGASLDLGVAERTNLYANLYKTRDYGMGVDLQALYSYDSGTLIFSHNRSWLDNRDSWETLLDGSRVRQRNPYNGQVSSSSLGVTHRLGAFNSVNARISYSEGQMQGAGLDLGWTRNGQLFERDANWRLSVFDRPAAVSSGMRRNRGVDLSLSLALGTPSKRLTASVGTRASRNGERERTASIGYQQDFESGPFTSVAGNLQSDTYGVGLSGSAQFDTPVATGDLFVNRSSYNDALSGSLNLNSHLVVGANKVAVTGRHIGDQAGMIVDVESDIDDLALRVDDLSGGGALLRPGRNVVPVSAYRDGTMQFDFQGVDAPAASISPTRARYHLNKGGVAYQQVRVMKTLTVLGRLLDGHGQPLKAHHVLNHASRGVTEVDGFFSMELSASNPTLEVVRDEQVLCRFVLDPRTLRVEGDVLMAGDLSCVKGNPDPVFANVTK